MRGRYSLTISPCREADGHNRSGTKDWRRMMKLPDDPLATEVE